MAQIMSVIKKDLSFLDVFSGFCIQSGCHGGHVIGKIIVLGSSYGSGIEILAIFQNSMRNLQRGMRPSTSIKEELPQGIKLHLFEVRHNWPILETRDIFLVLDGF